MDEAVLRSAGARFTHPFTTAEFELQQQRRAFEETAAFGLTAAGRKGLAFVEKVQGPQSGRILQPRKFVEKSGVEFARNFRGGEIEGEQLSKEIAKNELRAVRGEGRGEYV